MALDSVRRRLTAAGKLERPNLFMNDRWEDGRGRSRARSQRGGARLDAGETRAVILAAAALAIFLYFIKPILLPFILPAILAYICTPRNRLADQTHALAASHFCYRFFLVIMGIGVLFAVCSRTQLSMRRGAWHSTCRARCKNLSATQRGTIRFNSSVIPWTHSKPSNRCSTALPIGSGKPINWRCSLALAWRSLPASSFVLCCYFISSPAASALRVVCCGSRHRIAGTSSGGSGRGSIRS